MVDTTTTPDSNKNPSKVRKLLGMFGESIVMRSPILGQALDTASSLVKKPEKDESRIGNVINSVKQTALNNSVILRKMTMLVDAIKSSEKKDESKDPAKSKEDKKDDQGKKTKGNETKDAPTIIEYFDNKENPYFVMMQDGNNYLEQMVELLRQQVEVMKTNLQIDKEANERTATQRDLDRVSRSDAARASAALQPRDDQGRFVKQAIPEVAEDQGGVLDTIDDVLDIAKKFKTQIGAGLAAFAATAGKMRKFITSQVGKLGGSLKNLATKIKPLARGFAASLATVVDDAGKASKTVLPALGKVIGKGLGFALKAIGSTTFGAALGILDPSDLGDGTPEGAVRRNYADELRAMGYDPETGEAESPEAEANARAFIEEKVSTNQLVPERGLPPEQQAAVEANRQEMIDQGLDPVTGAPLTEEAKKRADELQRQRIADDAEQKRMREDKMRTTQSPPDMRPFEPLPMPAPSMPTDQDAENIRKYLESIQTPTPMSLSGVEGTSMSRTREYVNFVGNARPQQAQPAPAAAPVIVNNQGGPTRVNNGGNVTNIIMGGSSLDLPQLTYNLPSSLS